MYQSISKTFRFVVISFSSKSFMKKLIIQKKYKFRKKNKQFIKN